jgi:hypothetical protein
MRPKAPDPMTVASRNLIELAVLKIIPSTPCAKTSPIRLPVDTSAMDAE